MCTGGEHAGEGASFDVQRTRRARGRYVGESSFSILRLVSPIREARLRISLRNSEISFLVQSLMRDKRR